MLIMYSRLALFALLSSVLPVLGRPLTYKRADVLERRGCATVITPQDRAETEFALRSVREELIPRDAVNASGLKPVRFDVYWHIVYANETYEGGYVPDSQVMQQMDVLNNDYKSTNISWNFMNITRIDNADWFQNAYPGSPQEQEMKHMYKHGDNTALNVFTAGFNSTNKSLGFSSLPSAYYRDPISDGLMIRYTTLPGGSNPNYNHGRTTVHEIGHWLGLYHTFEGGCDGVGDNIDDTAPESSEAIGCPVGRKSCPDSKEPDPIHNFMDYSFDTCMTHFTRGQAVRMHEAIWAFRKRKVPAANSTTTTTTMSSSTSTVSAATATITPTLTSALGEATVSATDPSTDEGGAEPGDNPSNEE